jgi:PPOX class probable F420-dependent enzyme
MSDAITAPILVRGHLPWDATEQRLRTGRSAIISTTRPDGRPHAMPVWYCWSDARFYFITVRTTQKARNLAGTPWVVAHVGDGDDVLMLEGPVERVSDPEELRRIDDAYQRKYVDPVSGARASIFDNPADDLYRVEVQRVVTWMYGTVAGWTEWRFDGDASPRDLASTLARQDTSAR